MLATPVREWRKFTVVRLGVDLDTFTPVPFCSNPTPFRVAAVGQLQPAKGFHVLLDAVAKLASAGRDVALTLVGDGPDRESLEAHAADLGLVGRVEFAGTLTTAGVRTVLQRSDAFVLSSFAEGIPVVLMEAMASELACVASRITGVPELIEDGREGLLVTPSDEQALAAALDLLLANSTLRRELGRAARARIYRDYDLRANVPVLADVFASHVNRSTSLHRNRATA